MSVRLHQYADSCILMRSWEPELRCWVHRDTAEARSFGFFTGTPAWSWSRPPAGPGPGSLSATSIPIWPVSPDSYSPSPLK
jgi:hypothetical protein